jgi:predicted DNA-binding ribbon-helix-helix protein
MSRDVVVRSVRFEREFDRKIEALAAERGMTVSAYIRDVLQMAADRDVRRRKLERALEIAAQLPEQDDARDEMWGHGTRVPR